MAGLGCNFVKASLSRRLICTQIMRIGWWLLCAAVRSDGASFLIYPVVLFRSMLIATWLSYSVAPRRIFVIVMSRRVICS